MKLPTTTNRRKPTLKTLPNGQKRWRKRIGGKVLTSKPTTLKLFQPDDSGQPTSNRERAIQMIQEKWPETTREEADYTASGLLQIIQQGRTAEFEKVLREVQLRPKRRGEHSDFSLRQD